MKTAEYFRGGKGRCVLEVTKQDLMDLKKDYSFVSVSEADTNNLAEIPNDSDEIVGIVAGDIYNIDSLNKENDKPIAENPDCWFVYKPENHGYRKMDKNFECDFSDALLLIQQRYVICRKKWGNDSYLFLMPDQWLESIKEIQWSDFTPEVCICRKTEEQTTEIGWTPNNSDLFAKDWTVIKKQNPQK